MIPLRFPGKLSHVAVALSRAVAATASAQSEEDWTVPQVLQHLALDAEGEEED
jgi:hypothetical protein